MKCAAAPRRLGAVGLGVGVEWCSSEPVNRVISRGSPHSSPPAGGSEPIHGHGRVWLHEQRDEVPVQVRRPQSVHVRMSRRWGEEAFLLFSFISPLSSNRGGYDVFFPLSQVMRTALRQKTCLSTRGKSPTTLCRPSQDPDPTASLAARPQRLLRLRGEAGCFQEPGTLATTVRENTRGGALRSSCWKCWPAQKQAFQRDINSERTTRASRLSMFLFSQLSQIWDYGYLWMWMISKFSYSKQTLYLWKASKSWLLICQEDNGDEDRKSPPPSYKIWKSVFLVLNFKCAFLCHFSGAHPK